ncbi:MAG: bifunctional alpha,alpha-trehalose-phosphate synthase (UDP-forming)/trehalose-phosphatase [Deltaproteobacteria bacterium RIFCSPLOWO2_12_FULL_60_19]|nr:MAG: bifunctional alpha,alpha-trehalose-phosphate synthase (UDP-forming)/trehalose-phosphatase [Deltaproteobacteria bacterium RIFCSPLOWO2_12_FULL_60_19]
MKHENHAGQRIIIASNRLPFTVERRNGEIEFTASVGGVATGLKSLLDAMPSFSSAAPEYVWVGWPGGAIDEEQKEEVRSRARSDFRSHPVFFSEEDFEAFYQGFCNKTIWPLFHYFPSNASYDDTYWLQYKKVNKVFKESLLELLRQDDILWIHDYHLMLLPNLVRKELPKLRVGFFLHIPFPHFEIFRLLPAAWRREILEGLLGADLIGFHTHDYMEYFLRCVQRLLGYKHKIGQLVLGHRMVKVAAFPMGVDFRKFHGAAKSPEVRKEREKLRRSLSDAKIVLSVDRQDYSKGIIHRLQGFETMLEQDPRWHGKVTLLMVVVPSRIGIQDYEGMKKQIEELVGKINGRFGAIHWTPIIYQYRSVPFDSLVALYAISDVALVTPLRDGMNLVAKEYIASRTDLTGVLILSEMAGAAKELAEAIIINPNHREEIADALKTALEIPRKEQIRRNRIMQNRLRRHDVARWATDFIKELFAMEPAHDKFYAKRLNLAATMGLVGHYDQSTHRLLLFDYDGTLVPFASHPQAAKPDRELLSLLHGLGADPRNELVLLSGRDKGTLENWFGSLTMGLVAEHGAWLKERYRPWTIIEPLNADWKTKLLPTLDAYADRVPGAFVEEKEFSIVWHYRNADPDRAALAARELTDDLLAFTATIDVQVLQGNKAVEVRNARVHKGTASQRWLSKSSFDFILAAGDDWTDEDTFAILPERAYSIRVGMTPTQARFHLRGPEEVLRLLKMLSKSHYTDGFYDHGSESPVHQ